MNRSSEPHTPPAGKTPIVSEDTIEYGFIGKLQGLKYNYRSDITDRASLERNFREKFEDLNRVRLTDSEFARLLEDIVTDDVFTAAKRLQEINAFMCDDGDELARKLKELSLGVKTVLIEQVSVDPAWFQGL